METVYLLLPIIGAFLFLFLGCCFGKKMKEMLHIPKEVILGRAVMEQIPGVHVQEESESEDDCPTIRIKFRDRKGRHFTGLIPSSASRDSVHTCSDSGLGLLSASRQSIPPGTSVSTLLQRRHLDIDSAYSPSRLSLESYGALDRSHNLDQSQIRTYNFTTIESDADDEIELKHFEKHDAMDDGASNSTVTYGPLNWDHVVIIESLDRNTPSVSSVALVTDSEVKHSIQDLEDLYNVRLNVRDNPLGAWHTRSLQEVPGCFQGAFPAIPEDTASEGGCDVTTSRRLSVSLGALDFCSSLPEAPMLDDSEEVVDSVHSQMSCDSPVQDPVNFQDESTNSSIEDPSTEFQDSQRNTFPLLDSVINMVSNLPKLQYDCTISNDCSTANSSTIENHLPNLLHDRNISGERNGNTMLSDDVTVKCLTGNNGNVTLYTCVNVATNNCSIELNGNISHTDDVIMDSSHMY